MASLTVSERDGSVITSPETDGVDLPESRGTDVRLDLSRDDIDTMVRKGDDLIITLNNGEVITIEDYFVVTADELPHRLFTEEDGGFFELGLESGGATGGAAGGLGVLAGIGGLAVAGAALGGSSSGGDGGVSNEGIDDLIEGTPEPDDLSGDAGNDTIIGNEGDDVISGGEGDDSVEGGDNNDDIMGDAGADTLNGDAGDDTISGGDDDDLITGGDGADDLSGDAGNDTIIGNEGDDVISGGEGNDKLDGGDDSDIFVIEDGSGNDTIIGGEGGDDLDIIDLTGVTTPFEIEFDENDDEAGTITIGDQAIEFSEIEAILTNAAPVIDPTDGTVVTGMGDIGSKMTLRDVDDNLIGTAVVGDDGTWTITPDEVVADGTILQATQAPEGGADSPLSNQVTPNDTDGDLVSDSIDIDDDGDGITDLTENSLFVEDFGKGETITFAKLDSQVTTDFGFDGKGPVNDNNYAIKQVEEISGWTQTGDNSTETDGRFLVVNAGKIVGDIYARELDVDPNASMQIQFDIRNLLRADNDKLPPNVTFEVRDLDGAVLGSLKTGDIPRDEMWQTFSFEVDPRGNDLVEIAIVNNTAGTNGNDLGIDNIIINQDGADQDGDGVQNSLDTDSDGDGAADNVEAQNGEPFVAPSGIDKDGNGLDDVYESAPGAGEGLTPADTNDDARPDYLDDTDGGGAYKSSTPALNFALIEDEDPSELEAFDLTGNADALLETLAGELIVLNAKPEVLDLGGAGENNAGPSTVGTSARSGGNGQDASVGGLNGASTMTEDDIDVVV